MTETKKMNREGLLGEEMTSSDTYRERKKRRFQLFATCDTFIPSVESAQKSEFFLRSATSIGVDNELARTIEEEFAEDQRKQIIPPPPSI